MVENIIINGTTYNNVKSIVTQKVGGGTAVFQLGISEEEPEYVIDENIETTSASYFTFDNGILTGLSDEGETLHTNGELKNIKIPETYSVLEGEPVEQSFNNLDELYNFCYENGVYGFSFTYQDIEYNINSDEDFMNSFSIIESYLSEGNTISITIENKSFIDGTDFVVTSIGASAFKSHTKIIEIIVPKTVTSLQSQSFYGCSSLKYILLKEGLISIGDAVFQTCRALRTINIPNTVTSIGTNAFNNCNGLRSVHIPSSVQTIGTYAFSRCQALQNLTMEEGLIDIGNYAFYYCYGLKEVVIPNSVNRIGQHAFEYCTILSDLSLPSSITAIEANCFGYCYNLKKVALPDNITTLGSMAFRDCYSLDYVKIGRNLTTIGSNSFFTLYSMDVYDFTSCLTIPSLPTNSFTTANNFYKIYVPDDLYDSWIVATNWTTYSKYIYKASEMPV